MATILARASAFVIGLTSHRLTVRLKRLRGRKTGVWQNPWRGQTWLPLFQFTLCDMQPRADACAIVAELAEPWKNWDIALWFVQPSEWLDDATPLERFDTDPLAVLQAARVDRFVALG